MTDDLSPDDDDRLARLYRETADDAEPPGEWSSLRVVIGAARESGFDEEPPARIDALLLAAARQHAPAPRPRWWQRLAAWMKPVMMHPAMAGALALVVVVGVAGVMYRRGDRQVAQPAPPPAPPAPPALTGTAPPSPPDDVAPAAVAVPPAEPVGELAPQAPATEAPTVPAGPAGKRPPPAIERKPSGGKGGIGSDRGDVPVATSGGVTLAPSDEAGEAQAAPDVAQAPPPPPPPPPAPKPTAVGDAATVRDGDKALAVAELFRQAQAAARAGDCVRVRAVSAQVLARDPAYHRTVFAADRRIAACLPAQIGY